MKKTLRNSLAVCFLSCCLTVSSTMASANDNDLNYGFEHGGETDNSGTGNSDVIASPGMKAVYDKNGLLMVKKRYLWTYCR